MYDIALKINPNHAPSCINKGIYLNSFSGLTLKMMGKFNDAITIYDRAI